MSESCMRVLVEGNSNIPNQNNNNNGSSSSDYDANSNNNNNDNDNNNGSLSYVAQQPVNSPTSDAFLDHFLVRYVVMVPFPPILSSFASSFFSPLVSILTR